jgi:hypothetical protein
MYFTDVSERINQTSFGVKFFYHNPVKSNIKYDRFRWLKSTDDDFKSQSKQFWKHVASSRKINSIYIELEVYGTHSVKPCDVPNEFSKHFQSVYIILVQGSYPLVRYLLNICL